MVPMCSDIARGGGGGGGGGVMTMGISFHLLPWRYVDMSILVLGGMA